MRRPVKPFVTEYRGATRRPPGQGQSLKSDPMKLDPMKSEPDAPEPRAAAPAWPQSSPPEDGYEAALRAADALFSGGRDPAPSESEGSPAAAETAHPGGGRVLRSLEEPPSEEMLRLEAEYAPKKRGRKPGSKNKPKAPIPALADDFVAIASAGSPASEHAVSASASAPGVGEPADVAAAPAIATRPAATAARVAIQVAGLSAAAGAPRGERYAWVRTRLKPGEQWKRRLPKVAW